MLVTVVHKGTSYTGDDALAIVREQWGEDVSLQPPTDLNDPHHTVLRKNPHQAGAWDVVARVAVYKESEWDKAVRIWRRADQEATEAYDALEAAEDSQASIEEARYVAQRAITWRDECRRRMLTAEKEHANQEAAEDLRSAGSRIEDARRHMADAMDEAREAASQAVADGRSESEVARELGVTRMTVRAWLGKR